MRKVLSRMLVLTMTVLCAAILAVPAFAAGQPTVAVPVKITLSGTQPAKPETFTVKLKAANADCPMPAASVDGVYTLSVTGAAGASFPAISYDRVGVYSYTVSQTPGSNTKCTYDTRVYALTVYVTNAENGGGLESTAVMYVGGKEEKISEAAFRNVYETVAVPTQPSETPKTDDESNFVLYAVLAMLSAAVMIGLRMTRREEHP